MPRQRRHTARPRGTWVDPMTCAMPFGYCTLRGLSAHPGAARLIADGEFRTQLSRDEDFVHVRTVRRVMSRAEPGSFQKA